MMNYYEFLVSIYKSMLEEVSPVVDYVTVAIKPIFNACHYVNLTTADNCIHIHVAHIEYLSFSLSLNLSLLFLYLLFLYLLFLSLSLLFLSLTSSRCVLR